MATFLEWYRELGRLSTLRGVQFCVGEMESHREAYDDGLSPEDELREQLEAVA